MDDDFDLEEWLAGSGATLGDPSRRGPKRPDFSALRFEEILAMLEEVVEKMSDPAVGIEEATDLFESAGELRRVAEARLNALQERVEAIASRWEGGETGPS